MLRKILLREGASGMTRRGFLGGGCAAAVLAPGFAHAGMAPGAPANVGEIAGKGPLLRFGVASDVHIVKDWGDANSRGLADQERHLERALRWFDSLGADAVVFPGDMAHTGRVSELEALAAVWEKVFPRSVAADGRRVERLLVTGNHEVGQWPGLWDGIPDAELRRIRLDYDRAHLEANWKRIFREDYRLVWRREVKGVTFIGCQYPRPGTWHSPDICAGVRALARDLPADRPFFYVQHAHPAHTCYSEVGGAVAESESSTALAGFPRAVALSGHSHNTLCDERSVWQGAFTSIGCGSVAEAGPCYPGVPYDNGGAPYGPEYASQRMKCPPQVGNDGRGCLFVEVYADRLAVRRRSLSFDEPLGPDWIVPVPARLGGDFDFSRRRLAWPAPQFAAGARAMAEIPPQEPPCAGPGLVGRPVVRVSFPQAESVAGSRVFDYVVQAFAGGREVRRATVLAVGYDLPESRAGTGGECLFGVHELPKGVPTVFSVTPRNCYGACGRALLTDGLIPA